MKNLKILVVIFSIIIIIFAFFLVMNIDNRKSENDYDTNAYIELKEHELLKIKLIEILSPILNEEFVKKFDEESVVSRFYTLTFEQIKNILQLDLSIFNENLCNEEISRVQVFIERDINGSFLSFFIHPYLKCDNFSTQKKINFDEDDYRRLKERKELEEYLITISKDSPYFNKNMLEAKAPVDKYDTLTYYNLSSLNRMLNMELIKFTNRECDLEKSHFQAFLFNDEIYYNPILVCNF